MAYHDTGINEVAAGKPVKQAVAIAYAVKRGAMMKKKAGRG